MSQFSQNSEVGAGGGATEVTLNDIKTILTDNSQRAVPIDDAGDQLFSVGNPGVVTGTSALPIADYELIGVYDHAGGVAWPSLDRLGQAQTSTLMVNGTEVFQVCAPTDTAKISAPSFNSVLLSFSGGFNACTKYTVRVYGRLNSGDDPANIYSTCYSVGGGIGTAHEIEAASGDLTNKTVLISTNGNSQGLAEVYVGITATGVPAAGDILYVYAKGVP